MIDIHQYIFLKFIILTHITSTNKFQKDESIKYKNMEDNDFITFL